MPSKGRSLDDLPLAAYTTGMVPEATPEPDSIDDLSTAPADAPMSRAPFAGAPGDDPLPADPDGLAASERTALSGSTPVAGLVAAARRNPRLALGAAGCVALIVVGVALLGGGGSTPSLPTASASPSAPAVVATAPPPTGSVSVEVSGKLTGTHALGGMSGGGPPVNGRIDATWGDATGMAFTLNGPASAGTRTTDATFVLTWSLVIDGQPTTFTSDSGECTVGMAVQPKLVTGNYVCKKLKSDDGSLVIDLRGTYRT